MSDIKKKVLLICHTSAGQMNLGVLMSRMYFFPVLSKSAEEGIILTKKSGPFSLILLDGDLPEEKLHLAISMLRADQATKETPLVVITTNTDNASTEELLSQGCSAVLTKPLDASFVYGVLGRLSRQLRSSPRVPVRMNVEIREETPERMLTCTNISEGGLFLRTHMPPPEESVLHLKFTLPHSSEPFQVMAEVVRVVPLDIHVETDPGIGLRFLDLAEPFRRQIRNFVQWELLGDLNWEPDSKGFRPADSV